ncbi:hypothetical protein NDU88_008423 [Pleurodeles waltl]|uniref:Uncharacterized protein n=1 Tax=Pleurodeles waltl TaxID=8319 RepID=A0AAV7QNL2_PLEWA|nr:hypothetical protein NDU88_008423 [Pleurodeles waltl]
MEQSVKWLSRSTEPLLQIRSQPSTSLPASVATESPSVSPIPATPGNLPLVRHSSSPQLKEKHSEKPPYPLFSNPNSNFKGSLKLIEGDTKEGGFESITLPSEATLTYTRVSSALASNFVLEGPRVEVFDSPAVNSKSKTGSQTLTSSPNLLIPDCSSCRTKGTSTMEELMGQILAELRANKLSQEETHRKTKDQLTQLNTHLTLLSSRVSQVEQRVSDLEDVEKQAESATSRIQSELEDLQLKLDEVENRSRCSNLRCVVVPEETEAASSVAKVVSELIYKAVLPDRNKMEGDRSIMRAHRVPFTRPANAKYPLTNLVNFGDYRIKERILFQARKVREFKYDDSFTFCVFSDMSVAAAHQRRKFVGLIDDFKRLGAPAGIV